MNKEKVNTKHKIQNTKNNQGITMVALIITIIIMLILASVAIKQITGDGIVKKAEEAKLMVDYQTVKTDLGMYKLAKQTLGITGEEITDESLIGTVFKKVFINDTYRQLAVIVDFNEIDSKPTYGKGGKKLLKEAGNDKTTVKEEETLYNLRDVYAVDLADGILYYINGEQIYTLDGEIVEVEENETTLNKYEVETINQEYIQKRKFITKWNVTLGETEGSETYSTVVLPVWISGIYDATIYWGDGTETKLQHDPKGTALTDEELIEKVTHNYTLANDDDGIRTIEISGTYTDFRMATSTSTPTKLKLIQLEQWGYIEVMDINFSGCKNLVGIIPNPNKENSLKNCLFSSLSSFFANTGIKGLEEGFSLPDTLSGGFAARSIFYGCKNLEIIPNSFNVPNKVTSTYWWFRGCSNLKKIPENFNVHDGVTFMAGMFQDCKSLKKLPDNFYIPERCSDAGGIVFGCSALEELPEGFVLSDNYSSSSLQYFFRGCSSLKFLPENFTIPKGVKNLFMCFFGCSSLEKIPENFTISEGVTEMNKCFSGCDMLSGTITIKANPSSYESCFDGTASKSGSVLIVNYSKNCTNIEEILPTNRTYVKKGICIDEDESVATN